MTEATSVSNLRLAFLTNIIAPYWKVIFDSLSPRYKGMRVFVSTRMEANRAWEVNWQGLDVVLQKTITLKRRWRHPVGFSEPLYVHFPLDTVQQLRSFGADVVISNEMGFRTLMALLYRKLRPQSRLIIWAEIAESTEQGRGSARGMLRRFLQKRVDGFIVLGKSGARYIRSLGADDRNIFQIPYTSDVSRFSGNAIARNEDQARRLLYVGQLIERKGLRQFLAALSKWAAANQDRRVEFVLAGDGPLRDQLEHALVPANMKLTFLGEVSYADLPRVYASSGIFAFPTLADTWGVVVNEALASGLPVLGSINSQAVEELVEDGRSGWIFRPGDADEMYGALERSMNTPAAVLHEMRVYARSVAARLTPSYVAGLIDQAVMTCAAAGIR